MEVRRVLVSGSRDWNDESALGAALDKQRLIARRDGVSLVVVHGAARGADSMASDWASFAVGVTQEQHSADWDKGRTAGFLRNQEMVDAGAYVCLAFVIAGKSKSKGTRDCIRRAKKAGIPVVIHLGGGGW